MPPKSNILRFILVLPKTVTSGQFLLKDLPGSGKRIDILCRSLQACFDWGRNEQYRGEIELVAVLGNKISLTFTTPKNLPKGEVGWAKEIQHVLNMKEHSFIDYREETIEMVVERIQSLENSKIWTLDEEGALIDNISNMKTASQNSFMLGDNQGFVSNTQEVIKRFEIPSVSLGSISYLGSHCITLVMSHVGRM
jgi:tRNA (pseudouridine54-N1)-methyltransferase